MNQERKKRISKQQQQNLTQEFLGISFGLTGHGDEVGELLPGRYSNFCSHLDRKPSSVHWVVPGLEVLSGIWRLCVLPYFQSCCPPALQSNRCLKNLFGMFSQFSGVGQPWASTMLFMRHPQRAILSFPMVKARAC